MLLFLVTQQGIESPALFLVLGVSLRLRLLVTKGAPPPGPSPAGPSLAVACGAASRGPQFRLASPSSPAASLTACLHSVYRSEKNGLRLKSDLSENISLVEVQGARALGWMSIFWGCAL